ncbi:MAG: protein translocase subunit SecF [Halanaerobiales bacterium]
MDIIGLRKRWYTLSIILISLGMIFLIFRGLNLGHDFTGGTSLEFAFESSVSNQEVRNIMADLNYEEFDVQQIQQDELQGVLIKMQNIDTDQVLEIEEAFKNQFPSSELLREETFGPVLGRELMLRALWALLIASVAIVIYVSIRFEFRFSVVAIIALLHDVLITVGLFAILGREINTAYIAALLTIIGYSLNDTIVIFDRIRENMKLSKRQSFAELANTAVIDTLPRSINTSVTTLIVILAIYLFGAIELQNFMLALFIGMTAGTYSSIFVASPLLVSWREKFSSKVR